MASTVKKAVGGLLSAQDLSSTHFSFFLERAAELMLKLLQAFDKGGEAIISVTPANCHMCTDFTSKQLIILHHSSMPMQGV